MESNLIQLLTSQDPVNVRLVLEMTKYNNGSEFADTEFIKRLEFFKENSNWGRDYKTIGNEPLCFAPSNGNTPFNTLRIEVYEKAIMYGWAWNIAEKENTSRYFYPSHYSPFMIKRYSVIIILLNEIKQKDLSHFYILLCRHSTNLGNGGISYNNFICYFEVFLCQEPYLSSFDLYIKDIFRVYHSITKKTIPLDIQAKCLFRSLNPIRKLSCEAPFQIRDKKTLNYALNLHPITAKSLGVGLKKTKKNIRDVNTCYDCIVLHGNFTQAEQANIIECFTPYLQVGTKLIFQNGK
jgi:hypothetical protein